MNSQTKLDNFANLRNKLDQLGYNQPLSVESVALVERLLCDLVRVTQCFHKTSAELESQLESRSKFKDYLESYRAENGRLMSHNNELHHKLLQLEQTQDEDIHGLKLEYQRAEAQRDDSKMYSTQCVEEVRTMELDDKHMAEQLLLLQEKNLKAVVYTSDNNKKQLHFRRQRMDIDSLVPQPERSQTDSNYCCSVARYSDRMHHSYEPEKLDLLDLASRRCEDLENQLSRLEEELELSEKKTENFQHQIQLRDSEIERLRSISEVGHRLDTALNNSTGRQPDRVVEQLQAQLDLLQSRNAELESQLVNHANLSSASAAFRSGTPLRPKVTVGTQTCKDVLQVQTNSSCQTVPLSCICTPCVKQSLKHVQDLLNKIQSGRSYLMQRLDRLVIRERDLIKELSTRVMDPHLVRSNDQHKTNLVTLNKALEKRLKGLEDDCHRWRSDSQAAMEAFRHLLDSSLGGQLYPTRIPSIPEPKSTSLQPECKTPPATHRFVSRRRATTPPCLSKPTLKLRRCSSADFADKRGYNREALSAELHSTRQERDDYRHSLDQTKYMLQKSPKIWKCTSLKSKPAEHLQNEPTELIRLRQERDSLRSLLDKFERQLADIQSNVRVLTQERNNLYEQLQETQCELSEAREQLVILETYGNRPQSSKHPIPHCRERPSSSITRSLVHRLESDRDQLAEVLRQMTAERDSLQDRLHDLTNKSLNEKARLLQRLEDTEKELDKLRQDRDFDAHSVADMSHRINLLETERRDLLDRVAQLTSNHSKDNQLTTVERNLHTVQTRLDQVHQECEKWRDEGVKLRRTVRQLDQEKDTIQATLDVRTEQCAVLERELAKLKQEAYEYQKSSQTFELRVLRLTESAAERDTEYRQLGERVAVLEVELNQANEARDRTVQELNQTKRDLDTMINETRNLKMQVRCATDKQVELQKRLDASAIDVCRLKETCSCVEHERTSLLNQYRNLTVELDGKASMVGRLETQLRDVQHLCSVRERELTSVRHQNEALRKDVSDYQKVTQALESQCSFLTRASSESEDRVKRLQLENEEVHRELAEVRALCDRLERQTHTVQHQLTTSNLETDQLRAHLAETEREIATLRKQVGQEKEMVRNLENALSTSRDNELKAHKEIQNCRTEIQFMRERLDNRTNRLVEADREIDNLRSQLTSLQPSMNELCNGTHLSKESAISPSGPTDLARSRINSLRVPERAKSLNSEHWQPVVDTGMSNAVAPLQHTSSTDSVITESHASGSASVQPNHTVPCNGHRMTLNNVPSSFNDPQHLKLQLIPDADSSYTHFALSDLPSTAAENNARPTSINTGSDQLFSPQSCILTDNVSSG